MDIEMPSLEIKTDIDKCEHPLAVIHRENKNDGLEFLDLDESIKNNKNQSIELGGSDTFSILPEKNPRRSLIYLAGPSGAGKSTMARNLVRNYRELNPKNEVYLVSKKTYDPRFDDELPKKMKPERIEYEDWITQNAKGKDIIDAPQIEEIPEDSLFIFDDYEFTGNDTLDKAILNVINSIAQEGRQRNISMMVIRHGLTDHSKTKLILLEATEYIIYPASTPYKNLDYLLQSYAGVDKEMTSFVRKKLHSKWCLIKKSFPPVIIGLQQALLPNSK